MRRRIMGHATTCLVALVSMFAAAPARAEERSFGERRQVAVSAERMFGYVHTSVSTPGRSQSQDHFSVFGTRIADFTTYSFPRIAADVFVAPGVSIGGSLGLFRLAVSTAAVTGFFVAPRVGYAAQLSRNGVIWPRIGVTYQHLSNDTPGLATSSAFALTLEAPLVFLLPPRVALTLGPTLDIGLSGSSSTGGNSVDLSATEFGVQAGLLLYL